MRFCFGGPGFAAALLVSSATIFVPSFVPRALADPAPDTVHVVLIDKPVTVAVPVPEAVRRAEVVFLQLKQATTPKSAAVTWRIFLELPSAGRETSVDDPKFVGYVTSLSNPTGPANPPKGFTIQVPAPASRLLRSAQSVRLTFVPTAKFPDEGVRIGSVLLEPATR